MEESDPKPNEPTGDSLAESPRDDGDSGDSSAEHPIPSDLLESVPPEHRPAVFRAFSSVTQLAGPIFNPIFQRITSDHISRIIDNRENESVREHEADGSRRKYQFAYAILVSIIIVGLIVFFTLSDNRDLIAPLVAAVAGFLGGFAAGQRFRS